MKATIWNFNHFESVIQDMRQEFSTHKSLSVDYHKPYKERTKAQTGFIFSALIGSINTYFQECGINATPESIRYDLYEVVCPEVPQLMIESGFLAGRKPRPKHLSEMNREECSLFIDGIIKYLEDNKIFAGLALSPDIRHNWCRHVRDEDIQFAQQQTYPDRDESYLRHIRQQPCIVCGCRGGIEAHHSKIKGFGGLGGKTPDWTAVPLCHNCHHGLAHGEGAVSFTNSLRWIPMDLKDFCLLMYNRWRNHL